IKSFTEAIHFASSKTLKSLHTVALISNEMNRPIHIWKRFFFVSLIMHLNKMDIVLIFFFFQNDDTAVYTTITLYWTMAYVS
ncbi:MAG: hypothetical protein EXX96DRAFT_478152, partial [Benjaminiella poitrasii]